MNAKRCPYCGGTLTFNEKDNCYICDYCDTPLSMNTIDDEKILQMKERANKLFLACDFDAATSLYQTVVSESTDDAEAYWFLALCTYGIQYVEDFKSGKRVPTCHRTLYSSILNNEDYLNAIECADYLSKETYEKAAQKIDEIQRGILEIVSKEPPYDIFICYKETDDSGNKTKESDIAKDLYYKLTAEGYRTFYAPITLQEKAGQEYEPFIFAAINSAKIMFVIGFSNAHFCAPWVKNEWSRFLTRKTRNPRLMIISCYNSFFMRASDLPAELSKTQAKDLANASTNDLLLDVRNWIPKKNTSDAKLTSNVINLMSGNAEALCKRGYIYLEDKQYSEAGTYFNKCLDQNPELSKAYWGLLLAKHNCENNDRLAELGKPISNLNEYKKAIRFANGAEQDEYIQVSDRIANKINKTISALKVRRFDALLETKVQEQITESESRIENAQSSSGKLIKELIEVENEISQCIKECKQVIESHIKSIEENRHLANSLLAQVKKVSSYSDKECNSMTAEITKIKDIFFEIDAQLKQIRESAPCFQNLEALLHRQKNTVFALEQEKKKLTNLSESFEKTNQKIEEIVEKFEPAFSQISNGDYKLSTSLLG